MERTTAYIIGSVLLIVLTAVIATIFKWPEHGPRKRFLLIVLLIVSLCGIYLVKDQFLPNPDYDLLEQRVSDAQLHMDDILEKKELLMHYPKKGVYDGIRWDINVYQRRHLRIESYLGPAKNDRLFQALMTQALDSNEVLYRRINQRCASIQVEPSTAQ